MSAKDLATPWHSRFAWRHPRAYLSLHGIGGALLVAACLWIFAAIADAIPERGGLVHFDQFAERWLQLHGTETGESIFSYVSLLGAPVLIAVITIAILAYAYRRDWRRAVGLLTASAGGALLNYLLKMVFHRGRPEFATEFISRSTWSFPSGHAMDSVAGYGFLVFLLLQHPHSTARRRAIIVAYLVLVGAVGYSRVYLGVHYASDVIGGWVAGAAWLVVCMTGYRLPLSRTSSSAALADPPRSP